MRPRDLIVVSHAALSVTGGIQPGVLACALTPEFLDAGLVARLLMAMPPNPRKRWSEVEVTPGTSAKPAKSATAWRTPDQRQTAPNRRQPLTMTLCPPVRHATSGVGDWAGSTPTDNRRTARPRTRPGVAGRGADRLVLAVFGVGRVGR
jgi:hypothetical protein